MDITDSRIDKASAALIKRILSAHGLGNVTEGVAVVMSVIPDCDLCKYNEGRPGVKAVADARTDSGQWGNLCEAHLILHGVGLGLGRGQVFLDAALVEAPVRSTHPSTAGLLSNMGIKTD